MDPQESFRLFFSYILRKLYENDFNAEKFNFWMGRYRTDCLIINELTGINVQFDNIKNIIESTEKLFSSPDHTWIHSQLETYVLIRYNRDFDIFNIPSTSLTPPFDSIAIFVTEIYKSLIARRFDSNKAISLLTKNETAKEYLRTFLSKDSLTSNDVVVAINRLFELQKTDSEFTCLLSVPQLSFICYALPFYDTYSNEFQVKQSIPTSTASPSNIVNTAPFSPSISSSHLPLLSSTYTTTTSHLCTISHSNIKNTSPILQSPDGSTQNVLSPVVLNQLTIDHRPHTPQIRGSNLNLPNESTMINTITRQPSTLQIASPSVSTTDDQDLITRLAGLRSLTNPTSIPFPIFNQSCIISSIPSTTITTTSSTIMNSTQALPQRSLFNNSLLTNKPIIDKCLCGYCTKLASDNDRLFVSRAMNTHPIDSSEKDHFAILALKHKYEHIHTERPWFEMSEINIVDIDNKPKRINYVHSEQQTQISGTLHNTISTNIASSYSAPSQKNDLSPEHIFKRELNRLKRFENHMAILKSHKDRHSFPMSLAAMPQPTIGKDDKSLLSKWNNILNESRSKLIDLTISHVKTTIDTCHEKIESVSSMIDQNKKLEIEANVDKKLEEFIEKSWCKLIRHTKTPSKSLPSTSNSSSNSNRLSRPDNMFPTVDHFNSKTRVNSLSKKNNRNSNEKSYKQHDTKKKQIQNRSTSTSQSRSVPPKNNGTTNVSKSNSTTTKKQNSSTTSIPPHQQQSNSTSYSYPNKYNQQSNFTSTYQRPARHSRTYWNSYHKHNSYDPSYNYNYDYSYYPNNYVNNRFYTKRLPRTSDYYSSNFQLNSYYQNSKPFNRHIAQELQPRKQHNNVQFTDDQQSKNFDQQFAPPVRYIPMSQQQQNISHHQPAAPLVQQYGLPFIPQPLTPQLITSYPQQQQQQQQQQQHLLPPIWPTYRPQQQQQPLQYY
jgi:hypothetical protein